MKDLFFCLRPKQWIKNLFIFLPLIFGKKLYCFPDNLKTVAAFFLFSLLAGIVYIINDIIDLKYDRLHPTKSLRPIASGKVSIKMALSMALILGIPSLVLSFIINGYFGLIMVTYMLFNLLYSKFLKNIVIIDVFCIAGFFMLRVWAGVAVAKVEFSYWIAFMVMLLALFLGFNKRRYELSLSETRPEVCRDVLKKYSSYFIDQMISVVTSSIVVVYMLYTVDSRTFQHFGTRHLIYTVPFVYYGIFRYLYVIHKVRKSGDPTSILLFDKMLQLNIAAWIAVCIAVIYYGA